MKRLLYVVLLLAGASLVPLAPASAAACSGASGVTVVVQFRDEPVQIRCAPGDPTSGYDALHDAGYSVTNATWVTGAPVCQINGQPADKSSCWGHDYWSYWRATPGHSWNYSTAGAGATNPAPGSFEGWRFGDGSSDPDYDVPSDPTPTAKPTSHPTTKHPSAPGSTAPTGSTHGAAPGSTPTAPDASATPTHPSTSTPTASAVATTTETEVSVPQATADAGPEATKKATSSSGGNQSWIWGVVLVAVLGTAGAATAARRRRG